VIEAIMNDEDDEAEDFIILDSQDRNDSPYLNKTNLFSPLLRDSINSRRGFIKSSKENSDSKKS